MAQGYPEIKSDHESMEFFRRVYEWREYHAKIVDENPQSVFSDLKIRNLCATRNEISTEDELLNVTGKLSESLNTWKKPLLRLILENESFEDSVKSIECHNCCTIGHAAWACSRPYSSENVKKFFEKHREMKTAENRRRRQNKKRNARLRREAGQD